MCGRFSLSNKESVKSNMPAKFALEVNKGWFSEKNVEIGDKITIKQDKFIKINVIK